MVAFLAGNTSDPVGWTSSPDGRGTFGILSSCILTIVACCWTLVSPNLPAIGEGRRARLRDKLNIACIGMLGPDYLLLLAAGQYSSARRSVRDFNSLQSSKRPTWTLTHAFFADMGGFVLDAPDMPYPIPLDARQVFLLADRGYIDFPETTKQEIDEKSKVDGFARVLTAVQTTWFMTNTLSRFAQQLTVTTLELTTVGFVLVNFACIICWRHKPVDISIPIVLFTSKSVAEICLQEGHDPTTPYQRTPLDFLSLEEWTISLLWKHYISYLRKCRIPLMSRPIKTKPWNRLPGDTWFRSDIDLEIVEASIILAYSAVFTLAWQWSFPTRAEQIGWRISSVYTLSFGFFFPLYNFVVRYKPFSTILWRSAPHRSRYLASSHAGRRAEVMLNRVRKSGPDQPKELEVPLRFLIPASLLCWGYCVARLFLLCEDVIGLRRVPASTYDTVEWSKYIPHFGS